MLYNIVFRIIYGLIILFNGKVKVQGKENLPKDDTYILIAPHKSILDPIFIAIASHPRHFTFMAKKELFNNPFISNIIQKLGAFPVDRVKPGPSAIKTPVKRLKETDLSLIMFPSGTRHSEDLKGGAITIAKLSKKPIIPVVYKGPFTIKEIFKLKKPYVRFGEPFTVERKIDGVDDINQHYMDKIQNEFNELEQMIKD